MEKIKIIECKCGCKTKLNKYDKYNRSREYISGHNGRKYKDPLEYKRIYNNKLETKKLKKEYKYSEKQKRKRLLVQYKGNKCEKCKLQLSENNESIFDFHHENPKLKSFSVSSKLLDKNLISLKQEVDKCDLLCSNCHRLYHYLEVDNHGRKKKNTSTISC